MSSRNPDYQFVVTDAATLTSDLITSYEEQTGRTVMPSDPEMLILRWGASAIVQLCALINYTGNQNIPSRAEGENLDALAELFFLKERPDAQPSQCTMEFKISEAQQSAILIPSGTRVTDAKRTVVWATREDVYINPGETTATVRVYCETEGTESNGYEPGEITTLVDVFDYYASCTNTTTTDGGSDVAEDDEFYDLLRASEDAWSTAGARGGYIYHAMSVSTQIADVVANSPEPGKVAIYVLMQDGKKASEEIKQAVLDACSDEDVRPLTDLVEVVDPEEVTYDIDFKYYIPSDTTQSSAEIEAAVNAAVDEYVAWQYERFGRDINPSKLIGLLMQTGIKRVEVTSPVFTVVNDGSDDQKPQVAMVGQKTITNGGREDE